MEYTGCEELLAADLLEEGVEHEAQRRGLVETCKKHVPLRRELLKPTLRKRPLGKIHPLESCVMVSVAGEIAYKHSAPRPQLSGELAADHGSC